MPSLTDDGEPAMFLEIDGVENEENQITGYENCFKLMFTQRSASKLDGHAGTLLTMSIEGKNARNALQMAQENAKTVDIKLWNTKMIKGDREKITFSEGEDAVVQHVDDVDSPGQAGLVFGASLWVQDLTKEESDYDAKGRKKATAKLKNKRSEGTSKL